ncbi:MAG: 50S ribosomal protein L10, partial [Candidatus Veblenbacteria bacterium]|nr:50S ribosomal protein L10 [Candidatus Veblenbacteria bacterium]
LLKRCLEAAGLSSVSVSVLKGSVSVAVSSVDEVVPAKTLSTFAKAHDKLRLLGGVFDGTFVNVSRVQALAQLPGKQELMGQLVGTVAAPLRGLVGVLQGNLRGLAQVLRAISQKP